MPDSNGLKTREELIEMFRNEHIELLAMTIQCEGHEEVLEYSQDMENPPQLLFFILPEGSLYTLKLKIKVLGQPLQDFHYHQVVKKGGIPFRTRWEKIADVAHVNTDENPHHEAVLEPDQIPSGKFFRGTYPATSTFYSGGKAIFSTDWVIKISKKGTKPTMGY